jgi:hypothetical protein
MNPAIFTAGETWIPERIHALAIYCSDGRWGEAFDEFCHAGLGLPRYDRFAVPGGPAWATMRDVSLLKAYDAARQHLTFLARAHALERVVLITHYGCAFYAELLGLEPDACLPAQEADLKTAASNLRGWIAGLRVDAYVAMRRDERVTFHPLEGA